MGKTYEALDDGLRRFLDRQHMFFVATAPSGDDGHVNLSPKGYDTLRVVDETTVVYLDLTGSGIETVAHLRENGRITLLFCSFEGPPRLVRLYGRGTVVSSDDPAFDEAAAPFGEFRGARSVITIRLDRISDSCGYSVPLMTYEGERSRLTQWADNRTDEELVAYRRDKNAASIDGLPGLRASTTD